MAKSLKLQAEGMAALNPKKGAGHPWWSTAAAILAVYRTGNTEVIAAMEKAYQASLRE